MAEAQIYESIDKMGVLTLNISDTSFNINPKLTIPENAEIYYEKAKKAKRKTKGALIAIENTKKQLEDIQSAISMKLNKEVFLYQKIDESLIGGIKVVISDYVFDASIKHKLDSLKNTLQERG